MSQNIITMVVCKIFFWLLCLCEQQKFRNDGIFSRLFLLSDFSVLAQNFIRYLRSKFWGNDNLNCFLEINDEYKSKNLSILEQSEEYSQENPSKDEINSIRKNLLEQVRGNINMLVVQKLNLISLFQVVNIKFVDIPSFRPWSW